MNGTIEIKSRDFLKKVITENDLKINSGQIENTVVGEVDAEIQGIGTLHYKAKDKAKVIVKPLKSEYINIGIEKIADRIVRNSEIIYESKDSTNLPSAEPDNMPQIKPEDIVTFKFKIKNNSAIDGVAIPIENLQISDVLGIGENSNVKDSWGFKNEDGTVFNEGNTSGIRIEANEEVVIYTDWTVSYDDANNYDYTLDRDINNKVTLIKDNNEIATSEVTMKINPVNLIIRKDIVNEAGAIDNSIDPDRYFTIQVEGSDGKKYIVEAQPGKDYILQNLRYGKSIDEGNFVGVEYTVTEIVPMNYKLISREKLKVTLEVKNNESNDDEKVFVKNKKVNDSYFFDDVSVANEFGSYEP